MTTIISTLGHEDEYGFERGQDFDPKAYEEFISHYLRVLARRARQWEKTVNIDKHTIKKTPTLKRYIRKGIPLKKRPQVWFKVSGALDYKKDLRVPYIEIHDAPFDPEQKNLIETDLSRTFPENSHFKGADSLKRASLDRILTAFTIIETDIGYCQGFNYVAGLMLLVVAEEETAFWLFCELVTNCIPLYHGPDMIGLLAEIHTVGEMLRERKPLIWKHLQHYDLDLSIVLTKWFICLFVGVLPVETVLRIWDCLFNEGSKIMIRFSYGLIIMHEEKIFMSQSFPALVTCFKEMTNSPKTLNCHSFVEDIFRLTKGIPLPYIEKLRREGHVAEKTKKREFEAKRKQRALDSKTIGVVG